MENNLKRQFFSARNIELNNRLHRMKDRINDNLKQCLITRGKEKMVRAE